jgi:uncharacterized membrane protein
MVKGDVSVRTRIMHMMLPSALVCIALMAAPHGLFSDDLLRYQWDGWLTAHGVSPFAMTPNDVSLKDYSYSNGSAPLPQQLPYADMLTIYPPGSQILFAIASVVSRGNESIWKLTFWILLVIPSIALWRISPPRARPWIALAALSPIVLLHGFADSHVDAFMAVFMALALAMHQRGAKTTSAILLGVAISIKYLPLVMIPVLLHRQSRRDVMRIITLTVGTVGSIYLPFIGENLVGSLGRFTQAWQTNSLIFTVVSWFVSVDLIRPIIGGVILIASVYVIRRWRMQPLTAAALFINIVMVLSPVVHPWYLLAPLALMPLVPLRSVITWTFTMCLYAVGYSTYKGSGVWLEHPAALACEFIPVMVALVIDVRRGPLSLLDEHRA